MTFLIVTIGNERFTKRVKKDFINGYGSWIGAFLGTYANNSRYLHFIDSDNSEVLIPLTSVSSIRTFS